SSSSASGLPRVSATIRSRTLSSMRPGTTDASRARASSSSSPWRASSGSPAKACLVLGSRRTNRSATESARSRRATKPSDCAGASSSQGTSATRHSSGRPAAASQGTARVAGDLGEQAERRERHEEPVGGRAGREAEGDAEGVPLRLGKRVQLREERRAELVQPGERQLHLGLDTGDLDDAEARRLAGGV